MTARYSTVGPGAPPIRGTSAGGSADEGPGRRLGPRHRAPLRIFLASAATANISSIGLEISMPRATSIGQSLRIHGFLARCATDPSVSHRHWPLWESDGFEQHGAVIEPLQGMPDGTIGFRATGPVTRDEHRDVLLPSMRAAAQLPASALDRRWPLAACLRGCSAWAGSFGL